MKWDKKNILQDESCNENLTRKDKNEVKEIEPRQSKRQKKTKDFRKDYYIFLINEDLKTYQKSITSLNGVFWKEAINNEIESIMNNHTWELIDLLKWTKPIKYKWIFKKKLKPDGSIGKFKTKLVA